MLNQYSMFLKRSLSSTIIIVIVVMVGCSASSMNVDSFPVSSISGIVTLSGLGITNVTMTLSSAAGYMAITTTTSSDGTYIFVGLANGSYTVKPSLSDYTFNPVSTVVTVNGTNHITNMNFTASMSLGLTYSISGQVTLEGSGLTGVVMALTGTNSGSATTDASGNYIFSGLINGSYTIIPILSGYTFSPVSSAQMITGTDIMDMNFTATTIGANLWPKFYQKYLNTGLSPYDTNSDTGMFKWRYTTAHWIYSSSAI